MEYGYKSPRVAISQNTGGGNFGYTVLPGEYGIRVKKMVKSIQVLS